MEQTKRLKIENDLGLHGRAAARIVEMARRYKSQIFLKKDGHEEEVDGSSILSILTLACPKGTEVEIRAIGEDSEELLKDLSLLFKKKFGEGK
jgi:phosphocarrier protein